MIATVTALRPSAKKDARPLFVMTASGTAVSLSNPDPNAISIRDIAAHLSKQCRFNGATGSFYSVAQHSVIVADACAKKGPEVQLYALLHDAHEAYLGDIARPVKQMLEDMLEYNPLRDLESIFDRAIYGAFGLSWPIPPIVLEMIAAADEAALATEFRDLMPELPKDYPLAKPLPKAITPLPWHRAEELFLKRYDELARASGARVA